MTVEINMPSYVLSELILVVTIIIIGISSFMPAIDNWSRRFLLAFFSSLALGMIVFTLDMATYLIPELVEYMRWLPFMEYMLIPIPTMILNLLLLHEWGSSWKKSIFFRVVISIWIIYCIMNVIACFTDIFYYASPDGHFYLKPLHPLLYTPVIAIMMIDIFAVILKHNSFSRRRFYACLFYLIPAVIALLIHSLIFSVIVLNIASVIGSVTMYILILMDQIDQYMHQQNAIAIQNANILVLQMRPHFIYNTMTSIYYLCEQDPKKAQHVILDLTSYLRKNFNAMVSTRPIPFSEELEHIRAYLAVELAQFEDCLFVEYETPHTRFRLPPLTLQPLVENAIKHCLDPESEPLHILIRTMETDTGSVIQVVDNGPGFDPKDVFNSHNALSNIKQRLELMCHGSITIASHIGEGTIVNVEIPSS
ncbi:MAG: histidine kinase [Lachnospiraceae bacterium]|nr:histidine kinase [Lachnospiraceae bacterium]